VEYYGSHDAIIQRERCNPKQMIEWMENDDDDDDDDDDWNNKQ